MPESINTKEINTQATIFTVTIRIDSDVLAWLKSQGKGYQTRLNAILREAMKQSLCRIIRKKPICERGYKLAAGYAFNQFHWDGNKRVGNLMMNGLFLDNGVLPCPIPEKRLNEYNTALMALYKDGRYKPVIDFHRSCHQALYKKWEMKYPQTPK